MMGNFVKVGTIHDVAPGKPLIYDFAYNTVVIFQVGERYFCLEDACTHEEIPLSEGHVEDCRVECPMHGSWFDLVTGKALNLPATRPVAVYSLKVVDGEIWVQEPDDW